MTSPKDRLESPRTGPERRKLLLVAFHFPPQAGSSGMLRSLKFSKYLIGHGWQSTVLSISTKAYERVDDSQLGQIDPAVKVLRPFGLDARKHLAFRGRYLRWMALPDRWASWCLGALPSGALTVWKEGTDVILSTFPIATAVLIGYLLHRITGKPWVVDFRDPMTEGDYPPDPHVHRAYRTIEDLCGRHASGLIFTTPSASEMYQQRYPALRPDKCWVIPNGYDEEDFTAEGATKLGESESRAVRLLHTGLIYPEERNPTAFFKSLAQLKRAGRISSQHVRIDLRAAGSEAYLSAMIREQQIGDIVHLLPPLPYRESLRDSFEADALLLLQGASCNHQIPAKMYEYMRLGKPVLALTPEEGDTAKSLRKAGGATIVDLDGEPEISAQLPVFLSQVKAGTHPLPDGEQVRQYSRQAQAAQLARLLDRLAVHQ